MKNGLTFTGGFVVVMPIEWQSMRSGVLCRTNAVIDLCRIVVRSAEGLEHKE